MSGAGGRPDVRPMLADLWEDARERALARVGVVEDAIAAVMAGALDEELRAGARQEAHRLVGVLGTFGVAGASATARTLEAAFVEPPLLAAAPALAGEVLLLRRAIEAHDPTAPRAEPETTASPLAIVDVDEELVGRLDAGITERGWRIAAPDEPAALALVRLRTPADLATLDRISALEPAPAIAVLLDPPDGDLMSIDHVDAVHRGALRLMPATLPPAAILDELLTLERSRREAAGTVLALEADPAALDALDAALRMDAHTLVTGAEAAELPALLTAHEPDLLILDVDLPDADGIAVCRELRADPRWSTLPILFLTARAEHQTIVSLFAAGADDYVPKPVVVPELAVRVRNRLERVRLLRRLREVDPLTGLVRREPATAQLERLAASAERLRQPLWVAVLGIDDLASRNDNFGHAAGDRALVALAEAIRRAAGPADVAGRWAGGALVLGMLGTGAHDVRSRVGDVVEAVRRQELDGGAATASAGLAEFPTHGTTVAELVAAATATRRAAVEAGGDRVLHPWTPGQPTDRAEVVVVEDDEVLARLLTHALETRGYRIRTISDGNDAATLLGGHRPQLRTDLIVLDWDLPGRDGLTVLRQLAADGVLSSTRVLMLTARASEREVLAALELGADDYVQKPFSVAVLLQRVRRILGR